MIRTTIVVLAAATMAHITLNSARAADIAGTWLTKGGKSQVRFDNCGNGAVCGRIVWLKEPNDPETGKPKTDKFNADASKRSRPIIGVTVALDLKPSGTANQWAGQLYNPQDGKTYNGTATVEAPNAITLQACALFGVICQSEPWTRVK